MAELGLGVLAAVVGLVATWWSHQQAVEAVATSIGSTTAYIFWQPIAIGVIVLAHAIYRLAVAPPVDPNR